MCLHRMLKTWTHKLLLCVSCNSWNIIAFLCLHQPFTGVHGIYVKIKTEQMSVHIGKTISKVLGISLNYFHREKFKKKKTIVNVSSRCWMMNLLISIVRICWYDDHSKRWNIIYFDQKTFRTHRFHIYFRFCQRDTGSALSLHCCRIHQLHRSLKGISHCNKRIKRW